MQSKTKSNKDINLHDGYSKETWLTFYSNLEENCYFLSNLLFAIVSKQIIKFLWMQPMDLTLQ